MFACFRMYARLLIHHSRYRFDGYARLVGAQREFGFINVYPGALSRDQRLIVKVREDAPSVYLDD